MLRIERRVTTGTASDVLSLPYDERKKSRLRALSEQGREVAITLARGSVLRDGDLLAADSGEILVVRAAAESVSDADSADSLLLTRAAYHLGNRHVPLQIELGALRYQHDHVIDAMLRELGLEVTIRTAAFEPEGGAYSGHGHSHATQPLAPAHGPVDVAHSHAPAADGGDHEHAGASHEP